MTHRVIMWGTGACGIFGLRHIMQHPELELVGVRVFSSEKDGKTASWLPRAQRSKQPESSATGPRDTENE
jgi:hypothetical protein